VTDREETALIEARDKAQDAADELAKCIEVLLGVDCGEHSNMNCPWTNAIEYAQAEISSREKR
jgi:hypothetical protein